MADALDALGYFVVPLKGSGSRGAAVRRRVHAVIGDLLAIPHDREAPLPWLQIECGGIGKRLATTFAELRANALPGFAPLVVRFVERKRWHYTDEDTRFRDLPEALHHIATNGKI